MRGEREKPVHMSSTQAQPDSERLDDPQFLQSLRKKMLQFATLQLGDGQLAEDVVQDAMLGAVQGQARFAGRAALKTWVFAILRNKIIDHLRQQQRRRRSGETDFETAGEDGEGNFSAHGFWLSSARPQPWRDPEASYEQQQFWQIFEACLERLPPNQARIFMMREFLGLETAEICQQAEASQSNVFVMLHRARLGLRRCLEINWFGGA